MPGSGVYRLEISKRQARRNKKKRKNGKMSAENKKLVKKATSK